MHPAMSRYLSAERDHPATSAFAPSASTERKSPDSASSAVSRTKSFGGYPSTVNFSRTTENGSATALPSASEAIPTGSPRRAVSLHFTLSPLPKMPATRSTETETWTRVLEALCRKSVMRPALSIPAIWPARPSSATVRIPSDVMKPASITVKIHESDIDVSPRTPAGPSFEPS